MSTTTTKAPRLSPDEFANTLSEEEVRRRYAESIKRNQAKKPSKKKNSFYNGRASYYKPHTRTVSGYGAYRYREYKDPMKKIDPNTEYAFEPSYGARLGAVLGEGVQSFAKALGFGEYHIKQNSLLNSSVIDVGTSPPRVKNTNRGEATIVNHREYLGELVTGSGTPTAYHLQGYSVNVGNSFLFPFGARIAENYQEWEVRGMLVELKSLASNTATSLSLGSMFVAVDYNSLDPPPANKIELENLEYACSNKPTDSIIMPIECAPQNDVMTHLYVAIDDEYYGGDPRFYDLGNLYIGTYGCPTASVPIAEIWITYEIALYKPHLHIESPEPPLECPVIAARWFGVLPASAEGILDPPFYDPTPSPDNAFSFTSALTTDTLTFPDNDTDQTQYYFVWWAWCSFSDPIAEVTNPSVGPNHGGGPASSFVGSVMSNVSGNNAQVISGNGGETDQHLYGALYYQVPPGCLLPRIEWSHTGICGDGTGNTYWDLVVTRMIHPTNPESALKKARSLRAPKVASRKPPRQVGPRVPAKRNAVLKTDVSS